MVVMLILNELEELVIVLKKEVFVRQIVAC